MNTQIHGYADLLQMIQNNLSTYTNNDESLILSGNTRTGKTVFLNELIRSLRAMNQRFCFFGDERCQKEYKPHSKDRVFNPWLSHEFKDPRFEFQEYQTLIIPVLNDFINSLDSINNEGLFTYYPGEKDTDGNKFVLNSIIDFALSRNIWLIFDEIDSKSIIQNINRALHSRGKIAFSAKNQTIVDTFDIPNPNRIQFENGLNIFSISKQVNV
ncbi:hypothetical protein [Legionella saoudiensis]|uniref:hypothetical protein n=1 Tax=Legionella saoudiensis TaxID=1750561 RepID=UPI000730ED35|nr:hypothetical protein [Legionella saoudiensis]